VESHVVQIFEADQKRSMGRLDFADVQPFFIPGLKADINNGFTRNYPNIAF
jgi:hypothetical protein